MYRQRRNRKQYKLAALVIALILAAAGHMLGEGGENSVTLDKIPDWNGRSAYVKVDYGKPDFKESQLKTARFERHDRLDSLGRAVGTLACLDRNGMAKGQRDYIGMIRPTGWKYKKYSFVEGRLLYNRCHLIGWQLTGSTADPKNLVTGTRFMNVKGMLPWENKLADYLRRSDNHVMYKVVPIYKGKDMVCRGVHMQAMSVEDRGKSLSFNVYCYNVQPGVDIDYATGESRSNGSEER
ncbi:MAG: DNA/RNA non-specific endonuclease [Hornefia sp.]|nr:DNA/RNA non-specific endonuclease [Hornefia sp.]